MNAPLNIQFQQYSKATEAVAALLKQRFPSLTSTETVKLSNDLVGAVIHAFEGAQ